MASKKDEKFEDKLIKLEEIVTELEKGTLSLDDSVQKFEEGIKISKECSKMLESAEKKITVLLEQDGDLKEEEFIVD